MPRVLRCLFLVAVVCLTIWIPAVNANPLCTTLLDATCSPAGATTTCTWADGSPGICHCINGRWACAKKGTPPDPG
jgi:hypothetical protein